MNVCPDNHEESLLFVTPQIHKPMFHCDANPFVLGPRIGLDP